MATLHMEVETARSTQSNLSSTHAQLLQQLQSVTNAVNGLQSAWMGNSATEFFGEYESWRGNMNTLLENLNNLSSRLQSEINEWEQMAQRLG